MLSFNIVFLNVNALDPSLYRSFFIEKYTFYYEASYTYTVINF